MLPPFDAYLKILYCLYHEEPHVLGEGGFHPTYFQEGIILRAVDQLQTYKGCLLLIATGLGKTVVGAEIVRRITAPYFAKNVLILAPRVVQKNWYRQLEGARQIQTSFFDIGMLFRSASPNRNHAITKLLERLDRCDHTTVVLIDEAHTYRKVLQKDYDLTKQNERSVQQAINPVRERMKELVGKGVNVVMLTATPYGTDRENVNGLLSLLPCEKAPSVKLLKEVGAWRIADLKELSRLPVVTTFGLVHLLQMACERGDVEEDGRLFIDMGNGKKEFLPYSIVLIPVPYQPFLEKEIVHAFEQDVFTTNPVPMTRWSDTKNQFESSAADTGKNHAVRAWLGSPAEMTRFAAACRDAPNKPPKVTARNAGQTTLNDLPALTDTNVNPEPMFEQGDDENDAVVLPYNLSFVKSKTERRKVLHPLLERLKALEYRDDNKLTQLQTLLLRECEQNNKVIVFVKNHATAVYLFNALQAAHPSLKIGCMVQETTEKGTKRKKHALKDFIQRENLLCDFAPRANGKESPKHELNVLFCTDADGIGVNMQDACVVVNYDLPSGADELFQRAGRILRMTGDRERSIYLFTFLPHLENKTAATATLILRPQEKLRFRHDQSSSLLGSHILSNVREEIRLATPEDIEAFSNIARSAVEDKDDTPNAFMTHISVLKNHEAHAATLPPVSLSAKYCRVATPKIVLLFRFDDKPEKHYLILYDIVTNEIENKERDEILDLLSSKEGEEKVPASFVNAKLVETEAINAMTAALASMKKESTDENPCTRVCAVYLNPERSEEKNLRKMFRDRPNA